MTVVLCATGALVGTAGGVRLARAFDVERWLHASTAWVIPVCTVLVTLGLVRLVRRHQSIRHLWWLGPLAGVVNTATCAGLVVLLHEGSAMQALSAYLLALVFGIPFGGLLGVGFTLAYAILLGHLGARIRGPAKADEQVLSRGGAAEPTNATIPSFAVRAADATQSVWAVIAAWLVGVSTLGCAIDRAMGPELYPSRLEGVEAALLGSVAWAALLVSVGVIVREVRLMRWLAELARGQRTDRALRYPGPNGELLPAGASPAVAPRWVVDTTPAGPGPFRATSPTRLVHVFLSRRAQQARLLLLVTLTCAAAVLRVL